MRKFLRALFRPHRERFYTHVEDHAAMNRYQIDNG